MVNIKRKELLISIMVVTMLALISCGEPPTRA